MQVVPATPEDARAVAEIHVRAWQQAYRSLLPADYLAALSVDQREATWRACIAAGVPALRVAKAADGAVGWLTFGPCRDAGAAADEAEVWAFYVAPACWGTGAGRLLWLDARQRMAERGFARCSLWVLAGNERAIGFYRALGLAHEDGQSREFVLAGTRLRELRFAARLPVPLQRVVEAPGLRLEPQCAQHADEMFGVLCDPALYAYENAAPPSVEWLRARFARLESRRSADGREQWLNWVIRLQPGAQLIGYVQATVDERGEAAIAYELGSAHWGRGLARQAVEAMIEALAAQHGVQRLRAVLKRRNLRSLRLLLRLGFAQASPEDAAARGIEPDEWLMRREVRMPSGAAEAAGDPGEPRESDEAGGSGASGARPRG